MHRHIKIAVLAIAGVTAAAGAAYATAGSEENDALAIAKAKIPLSQAVSAAEQHVHGKASRAEFEHAKQGWVFDVEVVNGAKVYDVRIDADKGTVLSSAEDKGDRDGDKED